MSIQGDQVLIFSSFACTTLQHQFNTFKARYGSTVIMYYLFIKLCLKHTFFLPDHIIDNNQVLSLNKNFLDLCNVGLDLDLIIVGEKTSAPSLNTEVMHFQLNK